MERETEREQEGDEEKQNERNRSMHAALNDKECGIERFTKIYNRRNVEMSMLYFVRFSVQSFS
mgnify:CR=1 FL=1